MKAINLPRLLVLALMTESESFREYIANEILDNELVAKCRELVMENKGNKIAAIKALRELSLNRVEDFRIAFPKRSFTFSGINCLGLADAKGLAEDLVPIGHWDYR